MQPTFKLTLARTDAGFVALISTAAGEPWATCETMPTVDSAVLEGLRVLGEALPDADCDVVGVENGALVAV